MYSGVLLVHSWLRWAVILAGLLAVFRAIAGISSRREWNSADERAGLWFTLTLDIQMVLGLWLYFVLSPFTTAALGDFGAAMRSAGLRFWAVEHAVGMIVAVALAHVGRVRIRKAPASRRHVIAAVFFGIALVAILASIPWPGLPYGRPWVRW